MKISDFQNAWDCHFHVMDEEFPTVPNARVPNLTAKADSYRKTAMRMGATRGVVVQPSLYGTDNRCTLDALATLGSGYRAVVVINETVDIRTLRRWHSLGVRGIRFNQVQAGETTMEMMPELVEHIACLGWHVQLHIPASDLVAHHTMLRKLRVPLVLDHLGRTVPGDAEAEARVLHFLEAGNTWIKLSAPYLESHIGRPSFDDMMRIGRRLVAERPDRVLWGSDWPHVTEQSDPPTASELVEFLFACTEIPAIARLVLIDNPASLYGSGCNNILGW
jgi:predicted TIM-barrel fold metal-dependent hydrolase